MIEACAHSWILYSVTVRRISPIVNHWNPQATLSTLAAYDSIICWSISILSSVPRAFHTHVSCKLQDLVKYSRKPVRINRDQLSLAQQPLYLIVHHVRHCQEYLVVYLFAQELVDDNLLDPQTSTSTYRPCSFTAFGHVSWNCPSPSLHNQSLLQFCLRLKTMTFGHAGL